MVCEGEVTRMRVIGVHHGCCFQKTWIVIVNCTRNFRFALFGLHQLHQGTNVRMLELRWLDKLALHIQGEPSTGSLLNAFSWQPPGSSRAPWPYPCFLLCDEALLRFRENAADNTDSKLASCVMLQIKWSRFTGSCPLLHLSSCQVVPRSCFDDLMFASC